MSVNQDRRSILSLALRALPATAWISGCGGDGGAAPPANDVEVARFLSYARSARTLDAARTDPGPYEAPVLDEVVAEVPLLGHAAGVVGGIDRFGRAGACLAFPTVGASASVPDFPATTQSAQALTLWLRCVGTGRPMRLANLKDLQGRSFALDAGGASGMTLVDDTSAQVIAVGRPEQFSDGEWHLALLQSVDDRIQLIVDGAWHATAAEGRVMSGFGSLKLGGDTDRPWIGSVDALRFHDRTFALSRAGSQAFAWEAVHAGSRADSIAAYLPFNRGGRNETGSGVDAILQGTSPSVDRFGHAASAVRFEAPGSVIEFSDSFDAVADDFALAFWVRTSTSAAMCALSVSAGSHDDLRIDFNAGSAIAVRSGASTLIAHGPAGRFADGRWHFVLLQRSAATMDLFVDRERVAGGSFSGTLFGPGSRTRVGAGPDDSAATGWNGDIDDVQIYVRSFTATEVAALEWLQFQARDGAGALAFRDRLWLLGGWNTEIRPTTNSEVWSSGDGRSWRFEGIAPWEGRHTAGWLVHGESLWILGGDRNLGHYQNDIWRTGDGTTWERIDTAPPWADRALLMTASFRGRIWVFGGVQIFEDPATSQAFNDVYSSSDGRHWQLETASAPWAPRGMVLGTTVFDNKLWVIGGGTYDTRQRFNDVWCSTDGRSWERVLEAAPWSPRQYHNVVVHRGLLWVIGGSTADNPGGERDVWFTADGREWHQLAATPWPARHAASVASWHEALWVACGSSSRLYNDVWKLRPGS